MRPCLSACSPRLYTPLFKLVHILSPGKENEKKKNTEENGMLQFPNFSLFKKYLISFFFHDISTSFVSSPALAPRGCPNGEMGKDKRNKENKRSTSMWAAPWGSKRGEWGDGAALTVCTEVPTRSLRSWQLQAAAAGFFCGFSCAPSGLCLLHGTAPRRSSACAHTHPNARARASGVHSEQQREENVPVPNDSLY